LPGTLFNSPFTREGYDFLCWGTKPDGSGNNYLPQAEIKLDKDIVIYAIWVEIVTITYHPNGAEGNKFSIKERSGLPAPVEDNRYKRPGYEFVGWNTEPDGSGRRYTFNIAPDSNMDLYAE
jgi:uncharacterized repeat protein (TIGR02543 family)